MGASRSRLPPPAHRLHSSTNTFNLPITADYSSEPTTLVEFRLDDAEEGTLLTIVESGFDRIPLARRAEAFRSNDGGWTGQIKNIARYVSSD